MLADAVPGGGFCVKQLFLCGSECGTRPDSLADRTRLIFRALARSRLPLARPRLGRGPHTGRPLTNPPPGLADHGTCISGKNKVRAATPRRPGRWRLDCGGAGRFVVCRTGDGHEPQGTDVTPGENTLLEGREVQRHAPITLGPVNGALQQVIHRIHVGGGRGAITQARRPATWTAKLLAQQGTGPCQTTGPGHVNRRLLRAAGPNGFGRGRGPRPDAYEQLVSIHTRDGAGPRASAANRQKRLVRMNQPTHATSVGPHRGGTGPSAVGWPRGIRVYPNLFLPTPPETSTSMEDPATTIPVVVRGAVDFRGRRHG